MSHFAEIDENNIVLRVIVVANEELLDSQNVEQEALGAAFCISLFGGGTWKQTSYNNNMRKNYAGIGYTYDQSRDAFIPPKPYPSWNLDEETCHWSAPAEYPADGKVYEWDEDTTTWVERG
jgi:hypothetical protein